MIKAVIFDMDGVLINTEPLHYQCWVEIFKERYGVDLDYEVYKPCIGSTRLHFMNLIKENYGITFESLEVMNQIMKEKKDEVIARDGFPEMLGVPVDECIVIEDSTNGGKAAKAAKMPCIWMHNPDSGDQEIPDAVLEITAWTQKNIEKIMKLLHFGQEKV